MAKVVVVGPKCSYSGNNNNNKNFIQVSYGRLQEVYIKGNCRKRAQAT